MDKNTVLKAFYVSQITALVERSENIDTLDFIYRLLTHEQKNN